MPIVDINFDEEVVGDDIDEVITQLQTIVARATNYPEDDVTVFANANQKTVNTAPVEVFIRADFKEYDETALKAILDTVSSAILEMKNEQELNCTFNVNVVRMDWIFQLDV